MCFWKVPQDKDANTVNKFNLIKEVLDDNIPWKSQISHIENKLSWQIGILRKMRLFLDNHQQFYNSTKKRVLLANTENE